MAESLINRTGSFHWASVWVCAEAVRRPGSSPSCSPFEDASGWLPGIRTVLSHLLTAALLRSVPAWRLLMISGGNSADLSLGQRGPWKAGAWGVHQLKKALPVGERKVGWRGGYYP